MLAAIAVLCFTAAGTRSIFKLRAERSTKVMEVKSIAFLGEHNGEEREGEMRGVQRDTDENPPLRAGTDMIMGEPLVVVHHSPPPPGCCCPGIPPLHSDCPEIKFTQTEITGSTAHEPDLTHNYPFKHTNCKPSV